jgi:hypothetical protein
LRIYAEAKRLRPQRRCAMMLDLIGREVRLAPTVKNNTPFMIDRDETINVRSEGNLEQT